MEYQTDLAIILPIYNPIVGWDKELEKNLTAVYKLFTGYTLTVILVNDGSTICIAEKTERLTNLFSDLEVITYTQNKGKGYAIRKGLKQAKSKNFIYSDSDFPFGVKIIFDIFLELKNKKTDLVIGTRSKKYFNALSFSRRLVSKCVRILNFFLLGFKKIDTQAGIKGLNTKAKDIFLTTKTNSFIFELEFIKSALHKKSNITLIPIEHNANIVFSNISFKTIVNETINLCKIIVGKK